MNKPIYLGFLILELSNILMYQFRYQYIKPKYSKIAKYYCIHKKDDIYKDFAKDVERRFDTSNYELECNSIEMLSPKVKNKKIIILMKNELCRKIMIRFVGLKAKTCSYLIDDGSEENKAKGTKKCAIKRKLKIKNLFKSNPT